MSEAKKDSAGRGSFDNVDQLREEIDRGGTGDKVAFSDPSAAPLGTDDEAAGHPPRPEDVRRAAAAEVSREAPAEEKKAPVDLLKRHRVLWAIPAAIAILIVACAVALAL